VRNVNLIVPNQGIKVDKTKREIRIPCLNFSFPYRFPNNFTKINQIEISEEYIFIAATVPEEPQMETDKWIGIDLNTTGHVAVVAKLDNKYKNIRRWLQKRGNHQRVIGKYPQPINEVLLHDYIKNKTFRNPRDMCNKFLIMK